MPCQELVEVLTDYLEGALPERDRRRLEAHLAGCPLCTEYVEQFRAVIVASGRLTTDDVPDEARRELGRVFHDWAAAR
jgi:anti-sigma factor RsiW